MKYEYDVNYDVLIYLRSQHTGAENAVPIKYMEYFFGISGAEVRQIVNKLRCGGHPVCSNENGYFYAKNRDEISNTVMRFLSRTRNYNNAAQGLVLSHQIFHGGTEGGL